MLFIFICSDIFRQNIRTIEIVFPLFWNFRIITICYELFWDFFLLSKFRTFFIFWEQSAFFLFWKKGCLFYYSQNNDIFSQLFWDITVLFLYNKNITYFGHTFGISDFNFNFQVYELYSICCFIIYFSQDHYVKWKLVFSFITQHVDSENAINEKGLSCCHRCYACYWSTLFYQCWDCNKVYHYKWQQSVLLSWWSQPYIDNMYVTVIIL